MHMTAQHPGECSGPYLQEIGHIANSNAVSIGMGDDHYLWCRGERVSV